MLVHWPLLLRLVQRGGDWAELTMGQWVMGQMGQHIWMGHGSVSVTH